MPPELTQSDDDIMREASGPHPAAFAELFDRHHGRVYGYLRKLVGSRDAAHDLTQETFLAAFRARGSYRPKGVFEAWLYRIATNCARARFRRQTREPASAPSTLLGAEPEADLQGPLETLEAAERRKAVERALTRLSSEEREVVLLRHFQGMRFREVARVLDISESTAKSRMRYALDKLANFLSPLKRELQ